MSTKKQQEQAHKLRLELADLEVLPSSLRSPLMTVEDNTEIPGTADGVIQIAEQVLLKYEGINNPNPQDRR